MATPSQIPVPGRIVALHLHPLEEAGAAMRSVEQFTLVEGKGIAENKRYFARNSRRQLTLIEREQLDEHAGVLGLDSLAPGLARSNIETTGINLIELIGHDVQVGEAVVHFYEARTPCHKMDAVAQGLRKLMENRKQGVLATVVKSGTVRLGDAVQVLLPKA